MFSTNDSHRIRKRTLILDHVILILIAISLLVAIFSRSDVRMLIEANQKQIEENKRLLDTITEHIAQDPNFKPHLHSD